MYFFHSPEVRQAFPELAAGYILAEGISAGADTSATVECLRNKAVMHLSSNPESEWAQIKAWRRVFSRMGLKPTQYRCASEALLRRLRQEGSLPRINPILDLCNVTSAAHGIPVAVFDIEQIAGGLEVRHALGDETYETFGGDIERPAAGEIIFADDAAFAHARRWTNRQSGRSAVQERTANVLIVAEAMHLAAASDVSTLISDLASKIAATWSIVPTAGMLTDASPRLDWIPRVS